MSNISQILISLLGDYELEMDVLLQLLDLRPTELVILALLFINDNYKKIIYIDNKYIFQCNAQ